MCFLKHFERFNRVDISYLRSCLMRYLSSLQDRINWSDKNAIIDPSKSYANKQIDLHADPVVMRDNCL